MTQNWRFRARLGPPLRRGLLTAVPVGVALLVDLEVDSPAAGAISAGALLAGFLAFDAEPRTRCAWQIAGAPAIGASAALGALTGEPGWLAAVSMTLFAFAAALTVAVSPRLAVAGLACTLALLLGQGLSLSTADAPAALLLGAAGAAAQAGFTLVSGLFVSRGALGDLSAGVSGASDAVRRALRERSPAFWHAVRWGTALGVATAAYRLIDLGAHGYWIPLTVLFVLRPTPDQTSERIAMRAAGTIAGLAIATPLAELIGGADVLEAVAIALAAAFAFALLAVEYALFTTAITVFIVVEAHALGAPAFEAADERAIATALGLAIAAFALLAPQPRNRGESPPARPSPRGT